MSLDVPIAEIEIAHTEAVKWVRPFYMWRSRSFEKMETFFDEIKHEVSPNICTMLLSHLDWRHRITAALFSAIFCFDELEDHIGRLFLRSDVCFAGDGYCVAIARFNTERSSTILCEYLDYYLPRIDELQFNQRTAFAALMHLDELNGTEYHCSYKLPPFAAHAHPFPYWLSVVEQFALKA